MDLMTIIDAALGVILVVGAVGLALFFAVLVSTPSPPRGPRKPVTHDAPARDETSER